MPHAHVRAMVAPSDHLHAFWAHLSKLIHPEVLDFVVHPVCIFAVHIQRVYKPPEHCRSKRHVLSVSCFTCPCSDQMIVAQCCTQCLTHAMFTFVNIYGHSQPWNGWTAWSHSSEVVDEVHRCRSLGAAQRQGRPPLQVAAVLLLLRLVHTYCSAHCCCGSLLQGLFMCVYTTSRWTMMRRGLATRSRTHLLKPALATQGRHPVVRLC